MKIYVKRKDTNEVFIRHKAFDGCEKGKVQCRVKSLKDGNYLRADKDKFVKITKQSNPELFL